MAKKIACRICGKQCSAKKSAERGGMCKPCKALAPYERWQKAIRNPALADRYRKGVELMRGR